MIKRVLVYTMTGALGDYLIMGDLMHKVEQSDDGAICFMVHRDNPNISLWPYERGGKERFFNIYSLGDLWRLVHQLRSYKKKGAEVFGLQMFPGSLQGISMYKCLKALGALDYMVDFNLINADIITRPRGEYIFDIHLNQIKEIFKAPLSDNLYSLQLPIKEISKLSRISNKKVVGIHPWSRRTTGEHFVWQDDKWSQLIVELSKQDVHMVILGKSIDYLRFQDSLKMHLPIHIFERIEFATSTSVEHFISQVNMLDRIITVNTSIVHIGYALNKQMLVLSGPTLDVWIPKSRSIKIINDETGIFPPNDRLIKNNKFPKVGNIPLKNVIKHLDEFIAHA